MNEKVQVFREEEQLKSGLEDIKALKKRYDERKAALYEKQPKQRRLRHILVKLGLDPTEADVAKAQKFDLILTDGVIYAGEKVDITEEVIKRLQADFKRAGG